MFGAPKAPLTRYDSNGRISRPKSTRMMSKRGTFVRKGTEAVQQPYRAFSFSSNVEEECPEEELKFALKWAQDFRIEGKKRIDRVETDPRPFWGTDWQSYDEADGVRTPGLTQMKVISEYADWVESFAKKGLAKQAEIRAKESGELIVPNVGGNQIGDPEGVAPYEPPLAYKPFAIQYTKRMPVEKPDKKTYHVKKTMDMIAQDYLQHDKVVMVDGRAASIAPTDLVYSTHKLRYRDGTAGADAQPVAGWIYCKIERHDAIPCMYEVQQGNDESTRMSVPKSQLEFDPDEEPATDFREPYKAINKDGKEEEITMKVLLKSLKKGGEKKKVSILKKNEVHAHQKERFDVTHIRDRVLLRILDEDYRKTQKTLYLPIRDLVPVELVTISLACGFTCEDCCILGSCIAVILGLSMALLGMFLYVETELAEEFTALWGMFAFFVLFACGAGIGVYLNRTDARATKDEGEREAQKASVRASKRSKLENSGVYDMEEGDELLAGVVTVL